MNSNEIEENRQKLKEKIGNARTGGKGSVRRKHKVISKTQINDDKKLKSVIKKYGAQPFQGVDEVNFFKDDDTIMHFAKPEVQAAIQSNTIAVFGTAESKTIKDLMPDIIQHIGPKQFQLLQKLMTSKSQTNETNPSNAVKEAGQEEEDDVPDLVGNFEEVSKQQ